MFKGKNVLVTGGTGMIGIPLVKILLERDANVTVASMDEDKQRMVNGAEYELADLTDINICEDLCQGQEFVFHLAGVKGSPKMCAEKPASFFVPLLQFNTNMMEAARKAGVKRYLYTSSIGVYHPENILKEDVMWKKYPSDNDKFAGWAKRMGELQAEAYKIQYGWKEICIVRPANVYGPFDNFDPENAMVIPSLIARSEKENPLSVWGDGTPIRDFIYADDVANAMITIFEKEIFQPVNIGSGTGVDIYTIANLIAKNMNVKIEWDISKPKGDPIRLMSTIRLNTVGFKPKFSLEEGIQKTIEWYKNNKNIYRYNVFTEDKI